MVLCDVVCGVLWCPRVYVQKRLRVYVQNVTVCTGTTPACVSTCGRGAGTHGDVLNLHKEGFLYIHTEERGRGEREERGVTVSSAYREKPTKSSHLAPQVHRKKLLDLTHSKFENR